MAETLAIIDTDVAVLLLDTRKNATPQEQSRIERARQAVRDVKKQGARCLITTPTVVELAAWPGPPPELQKHLRKFLGGLRHLSLTVKAAEASGRILLEKLKPRPPGKSKNEIKFDALIAGIAHAAEARWLVTGNASDYRPLLVALSSPVQLLDIDGLPPPELRSQLTLADRKG